MIPGTGTCPTKSGPEFEHDLPAAPRRRRTRPMSRRCHHGSPRHARNGRIGGRPLAPERAPRIERAPAPERPTAFDAAPPAARPVPESRPIAPPSNESDAVLEAFEPLPTDEVMASPAPAPPAAVVPAARPRPAPNGEDPMVERGATAPQLRRFIKSRAYVPMHELRRRFAINGGDDDVTVVELDRQRVYVGLPDREGRLLGELLRAGDIGYELSMDPISPIVVGVYPMRPVTRV
jgi:hypothetical protein